MQTNDPTTFGANCYYANKQPLQRLFIRIVAIGPKGCRVVCLHLVTLFTQFYSRSPTTQQPNNLCAKEGIVYGKGRKVVQRHR